MPTIDGRPITITHPDKVLFPDDAITKADLIDYYRRIAPPRCSPTSASAHST